MRRVVVVSLVMLVAAIVSSRFLVQRGAIVLFALVSAVAVIILMNGKFNIARFGTPWIIDRRDSPVLYWMGVVCLLSFLWIIYFAASKK